MLTVAGLTGGCRQNALYFVKRPGSSVPRVSDSSYRLMLRTADALLLINRTVCLDPCTTTCITPEIEYSLL